MRHSAPPFAPRLQLRHSASATPQNQLQLAECTCRKGCMVGCEVICGGLQLKVRSKLGLGAKPATPCLARIGTPAKSIAPCRMQLQKKKVHGGLRGEKWGWYLKSLYPVLNSSWQSRTNIFNEPQRYILLLLL